MKQLIHKIGSVVMAFIVLFSTFSFTISSHYCGDVLVDSSIFSSAEDCGMAMDHDDGCDTDESEKVCNTSDSMHCLNVEKSVEGNTIEQQALDFSELPKVHFALAFVAAYQSLWIEEIPKNLVANYYSPPWVTEDVTILFENFRI